MKKIYFDHNATTPIDKEVLDVMFPVLGDMYGNPSSIHWAGREVRGLVETAREKAAGLIGAQPNEIVFTSCGSESDNLAIKGAFLKNKNRGNHIITTSVEHPAVLEVCKYLAKNGAEVTFLKVDSEGLFDIDDLKKAIRKETILITVMHANNETGVIFPLEEVGKIAREKGILFHTDAVQTAGKIPLDVNELNVDMLSIAGHKIYGPKGVGLLYVRKGVKLENLIHGGHQERNRRAGTENTAFIIGMGKACEVAKRDLHLYSDKVKGLKDKMEGELLKQIKSSRVNGHLRKRVPSTSNMSYLFIEGESILLNLDMYGVAASSGSACSSGSLDPSHVLLAMGLTHEEAHGSIRLSLGKENTEQEIDYVVKIMPEIVERLRKISPLYEAKMEKAI